MPQITLTGGNWPKALVWGGAIVALLCFCGTGLFLFQKVDTSTEVIHIKELPCSASARVFSGSWPTTTPGITVLVENEELFHEKPSDDVQSLLTQMEYDESKQILVLHQKPNQRIRIKSSVVKCSSFWIRLVVE